MRVKAIHLERGENPDDPDVRMQDVADAMSETIRMLTEIAEEEGIDLDEEPLEPPFDRNEAAREHAVVQQAHRWMDRLEPLLARIRGEVPGIGLELAKRLEDVPDSDLERVHAETLDRFAELREAYEVLIQYRFFIAVKLTRALGALEEAKIERSREIAGYTMDDANGTAKLVHECLGKAIDSLWSVAEFDRS